MPWKKIPFADEISGNGGGSVSEEEGTPQIVSSLQLVSSGYGRIYGVDIYGRYAYVASYSSGKLFVVDIKDPENLEKIGEVQCPTSPEPDCRWPIALGRYVITEGFDEDGNPALHTIDVSDAENPEIVAYSSIKAHNRKIIRNKIIYACDGYKLKLIDASDPTSLELLAEVQPYGDHTVYCVDVRNDIACIAGEYRFAVIDVSDPHNPQVNSTLLDGTNFADSVRDIKIVGRYAFLANFGENVDDIRIGITVVDISDPENPTVVNRIDDTTILKGNWGLEATDRYAYVCSDLSNYFSIVDITNPNNMNIVGYVHDDTILDGVLDCKLYGKYAIAVSTDSGYIASIKLSGYAIPNIRTQGLTANRMVSEYLNVDKHLKAVDGTFGKLNSMSFYPPIHRCDYEPIIKDGQMIIWHDTLNNKYYLVIRDKGNQKKVELT